MSPGRAAHYAAVAGGSKDGYKRIRELSRRGCTAATIALRAVDAARMAVAKP
jgi:hypothetical protein